MKAAGSGLAHKAAGSGGWPIRPPVPGERPPAICPDIGRMAQRRSADDLERRSRPENTSRSTSSLKAAGSGLAHKAAGSGPAHKAAGLRTGRELSNDHLSLILRRSRSC